MVDYCLVNQLDYAGCWHMLGDSLQNILMMTGHLLLASPHIIRCVLHHLLYMFVYHTLIIGS